MCFQFFITSIYWILIYQRVIRKKYDNAPRATSCLVLSKKVGNRAKSPFLTVIWQQRPYLCCLASLVISKMAAAQWMQGSTSHSHETCLCCRQFWAENAIKNFTVSFPAGSNSNILTPSALLHLTWVPHFYTLLYYHFSWLHHSFTENNFTNDHFLSLCGQNWSNPLLE